MNSKLTHAILAVCTLLTASIAQSPPLTTSGFVKLDDVKGVDAASAAPALAVLGMSLLPYEVVLPFGNMLYVTPDVVTIWDPDLKLPKGFPADITVYAQKLSLSGAFTTAPMADTAIRLRGIHPNSDRQSSVVRMSACGGSSRGFAGGFAGRFRLPTQGGVIVGTPGDT